MNAASLQTSDTGPATTSLGARLLNLFVSPTLVFDEVIAASPKPANWLVPVVLVCLINWVILNGTTNGERTTAAIGQLLEAGKVTPGQAAALSAHWQSVSGVAMCLGAFAGTFWSAFVVWFIGRVFLRSRFAFVKALEVTGLTTTILVLGAMVTGLLVAATGDPSARPAVSLLPFKLDPGSSLRMASEGLNCFALWTTAVLAIGLSRLSGASVKEAAFWVFGYWVFVKVALVALA